MGSANASNPQTKESAMLKPGYVATARVHDPYAGVLLAYLKPQRTTRQHKRVVVYRWHNDRGTVCDGLAYGRGANAMVMHACRNPRFTDVAVCLHAARLFN
jgi:hypothetical protein